MGGSYDGSIALDRKLTEEETKELRLTLLPYFHTTEGAGVEDVSDFVDYAFAMVSNQKSVEYVVNELLGMEMDFCSQEVADKVGNELSTFIRQLLSGGDEKGENAPTSSAKVRSIVMFKV